MSDFGYENQLAFPAGDRRLRNIDANGLRQVSNRCPMDKQTKPSRSSAPTSVSSRLPSGSPPTSCSRSLDTEAPWPVVLGLIFLDPIPDSFDGHTADSSRTPATTRAPIPRTRKRIPRHRPPGCPRKARWARLRAGTKSFPASARTWMTPWWRWSATATPAPRGRSQPQNYGRADLDERRPGGLSELIGSDPANRERCRTDPVPPGVRLRRSVFPIHAASSSWPRARTAMSSTPLAVRC